MGCWTNIKHFPSLGMGCYTGIGSSMVIYKTYVTLSLEWMDIQGMCEDPRWKVEKYISDNMLINAD